MAINVEQQAQMTTEINPINLTPELAKILFDFFEYQTTQEKRIFWKKATPYRCPDGTNLMFIHDVVQRKRKNNDGLRYEFISDIRLGLGAHGDVREIAGTLAIDKDRYKYKEAGAHKDKTRAVKIYKIKRTVTSKIIDEYQFIKDAGHLAVKEPVFVENEIGLTVMKKIKGKELHKIINDDIEYLESLSTQQRLDLSKALLQALKNQVTDKGIIHRDIKPKNIIVDLNKQITVTICDYGYGVKTDKPDGKCVGSPSFAAPEIFEDTKQTVTTDVYSMARIIALIWHVDTKSYLYETILEHKLNYKNRDLSNLFSDIIDLDEQDRLCIQSALEGMLQENVLQRIPVETAIELFDKVAYSKKNIPIKQNQQVTSSELASNTNSSCLYSFFSMFKNLQICNCDQTQKTVASNDTIKP